MIPMFALHNVDLVHPKFGHIGESCLHFSTVLPDSFFIALAFFFKFHLKIIFHNYIVSACLIKN